MAGKPGPQPTSALRRTLTRFDKSKIKNRWLALRNALAVALPLAIGIEIGNPLGAVAITTGALNVAYADGDDPYAQRARRMLAWSILGGVAVFTGSITGEYNWAAIPVAALWAFIAGMLVSISTRAGDLGLNTLVTLIVFGARGALSPKGAFYAGLLVVGGGLLQTLFSLLLWPVRRYEPERRAIAKVYLDLAKEADPDSGVKASTPLNAPSSQTQDVLTALGRDRTLEGERLRLLFDQADRIRMSVFLLGRLRSELEHEERRQTAGHAADYFHELLEVSSKLLEAVGQCLTSNECVEEQPQLLQRLYDLVERAQAYKAATPSVLMDETASAVDALAGQLRAVIQLAGHTTPAGMSEFLKLEQAPPWKLQVSHWLATLRANLDMRSSSFRHALRLTVCVAIADAIGRGISWNRSYWLPMTVAVILKPDFTTTFARGTLRLAGTFAGLIVATVLYHLFPASAAITQLFLVGMYTFLMRWIGPANYGVFSVAISGLIVFLIAATGIAPAQVVAVRASNTAAGGLFALLAYAVWPTWERTQVSQAMADMLDACRLYFQAVVERFGRSDESLQAELDQRRIEWRRARSNAEGSVDRVAAEPGTTPERLDCLNSMLVSSHALAHAIMALEAETLRLPAHTPPEVFQIFANDVELTLYFLAAALRGSSGAHRTLPKLRDDHRRLVEARGSFSAADEFVLIETDHLTVSLNTLREQVLRYSGQ